MGDAVGAQSNRVSEPSLSSNLSEATRPPSEDDSIAQRNSTPTIAAPHPIKSSLKNSTNSLTVSAASKAEDGKVPPRLPSNPKSNASTTSLTTDTKRPHHQRFPSTGISVPSGNNPAEKAVTDQRAASATFGPKTGLLSASSVQFSPSTSTASSYTQLHGRGHRRQPSMGREQRQVQFCPYDGYCFVLDEPRCGICGEERGSLPAPANGNGQPWRKVLYEKQGFEDNYTDRETFLAELKKNVNVEDYSYPLVLADSFVITQQISIVVIFVAIFMLTLNDIITVNMLGIVDIVTALGGYLIWAICQTSASLKGSRSQLISVSAVLKLVGYGLGLYVVSPVLAALTDPISDDTISTMSIILLIVHLSFQDYGYLSPITATKKSSEPKSPKTATNGTHPDTTVPKLASMNETGVAAPTTPLYHAPVSLNAGIFAALLLASRLRSYSGAFVILAFAVELFALFPIMVHYLKLNSWYGSFALVVSLVLVSIALLRQLSNIVTYIYVGTIVFATFISPFCLQWIQRYKNEIHGPWDEAVPARARRHGTRQ